MTGRPRAWWLSTRATRLSGKASNHRLTINVSSSRNLLRPDKSLGGAPSPESLLAKGIKQAYREIYVSRKLLFLILSNSGTKGLPRLTADLLFLP
jgi:hypothetical protein